MANNGGNALQSAYLNELRKHRSLVTVYLVSGIRLAGRIESFDQHVVMLQNGDGPQLLYKHRIATILPSTTTSPARKLPAGNHAVRRAEPPAAVEVTRKVSRRTTIRDK